MAAALDEVARSASFVKESSRSSWAARLYGEAGPDALLAVPPPARDPDAAYGARAAARQERGFTVGASFALSQASIFAGGRWLFATPSLLPDVMVDAEGVLTHDGRVYSVVDVLATYRFDFVSRLFVGGGPMVRWWSVTSQEVEWDWVAGVEFHFGRLRVSAEWRRIGSLNATGHEARVSYAL